MEHQSQARAAAAAEAKAVRNSEEAKSAASLPSSPTPDGPSPPSTPVPPTVPVPVPVAGEFGVSDVPEPGVSEDPGVVGETLGLPLLPAALQHKHVQ